MMSPAQRAPSLMSKEGIALVDELCVSKLVRFDYLTSSVVAQV